MSHREDDRGRKRARDDDDDEVLYLASAFCKLGDQLKGVEDKLSSFARDLDPEIDRRADLVADLCIQGSQDMSHKAAIYGTLVGLLNRKNGHLGANVADQISTRLEDALRRGQCSRAKTYLVLCMELTAARVLSSDSVVGALNLLADGALNAEAPKDLTIFFAWLVCASMPFAGPALNEVGAGEELAGLMSKLGKFMDAYATKPPAQSALSSWTDGRGAAADDGLLEAWECATACQEAGWATVKQVTHIQAEFKHELSHADVHPLRLNELPGDIKLADKHEIASIKAKPVRVLEEAEEKLELTPHEGSVLRGQVRDILVSCESIHTDCARILAMMPHRPRQLVVDTLLGQLLQLPRPTAPLAHYCMTSVVLCKLDPRYEPLFVSALHTLFEDCPTLEVECQDRVTEWFALFLSQHNFNWAPWFDPSDASGASGLAVTWGQMLSSDSDTNSPHQAFVAQLLERCVRLGGHERFAPPEASGEDDQATSAIPATLHCCLAAPSSPERADSSEHYEQLLGLVKAGNEGALQEALDQSFNSSDDAAKTKLVCTAVLETSKNLPPSICLRRFTKNQNVLKALGKTIEARVALVEAIVEFYADSAHGALLLVPSLLAAGIVDTKAMVHCLVDADRLPKLATQAPLFELLERALQHVVSLSARIDQDLLARQAGPHPADDARHQEWLQRTTQLQQKALRMQKETFLALFERFSGGLAAHISECRSSGQPEGEWLSQGLARLRQCGRKYWKEIQPFMGTLESVVMSTVNELRVSEVFESFKEF